MNQTVLQKVISSNLLMKKGYIDSMENVLYYYFICIYNVKMCWPGPAQPVAGRRRTADQHLHQL